MDVLRSCYASEWRFPGIAETVKGRFFFNEDAPFYPDLTFFGSRNWHFGDRTPWPEFGELQEAKQRWRNGSFGGPFPAALLVGERDQADGTAPMPAADGATSWGLPLACWPDGPPRFWCSEGGDSDDGTSAVLTPFVYASEGGDSDDGTSAVLTPFVYASEGGDGDDGTSEVYQPPDLLSEGGDSDDGTSAVLTPFVYASEGGDGDDGTSDVVAPTEWDSEGGDGDDGTSDVVPPPTGVSFGGCTGVPTTLNCNIQAPLPPGYGLHNVNTTVTWDGSQFVGTFSACGGTSFTVTMYQSGGTVFFTLVAGPFTWGPYSPPTVACSPFYAGATGSGFFPSCGPPTTLLVQCFP